MEGWLTLVVVGWLAVRGYHPVRPLSALASTKWTHVAACGRVVYVRRQRDGDLHVSLTDATATVVAEIVPERPIDPPPVGSFAVVAGVGRRDEWHAWQEVHPTEFVAVVPSCPRR